MEIIKIVNDVNVMCAIEYVYNRISLANTSYTDFVNCIVNCSSSGLPEFYIIKDNGKYIGYLFLLADTMKLVPKPFTFIACHNGDTLSKKNHCDLLEFMIGRAVFNKCQTLYKLANHELLCLQEK